MKFNLIYFDDDLENLKTYELALNDTFNFFGSQDVRNYQLMLERHNPHAILVDVHMPDISGHALLQQITSHQSYNGCPIVFISGDISPNNQLRSFEGGAVGFFPREISIDEMKLRLISKIRFYLQNTNRIRCGNLTVDFLNLKVWINREQIDITLNEMKILTNLLRNAGDEVTRKLLIEKIWGDEPVKPGTINTHVTNLNGKLSAWDHTVVTRNESVQILVK